MQRLRAVRQEHDLTLEQAGRASGLSASPLCKIENGLMSPTYDVLQKLAIGLSLDVSELFTPAREPMGAGRCVVDRYGQGKLHKTRYYEHLLLCSQLSHKRMMPFLTRITARDLSAFAEWNRHEGEEFVYVISGEIQLHTEYYAEATLGPGDSFYIDSRMGHRCISVSKDDAQVLWMATQLPEQDTGDTNE